MKIILKNIAFALPFALFVLGCSEEGIEESGEGTLIGKVVTASGNQPLENVKISTTPVSTTVFTDIDGNFLIDNISEGKYSVQAELDEFETAFEAANISDGGEVNVVFELDSVASKNLPPEVPVLLSPIDGEEILHTDVQLIWNSSENDQDEIMYRLEVRNGVTNQMIIAEQVKDTSYILKELEVGVNYFWQVTANDNVNNGVSSSIASFKTLVLENNRVFFTRNVSGNNVIFSAPDTQVDQQTPEEAYRLTTLDKNSFRPRRNNNGKIAFLRTVGAETHLFTMNSDGSDVNQITRDIPVAGFNLEEIDFAWFNNGAQLYYPNFDKLYAINADGTGVQLVYTEPSGRFITEVAVNDVNDLIVIKTNNSAGYNARIVVIDPDFGTEIYVVAQGMPGAMGGLDFSIGGTKVLYTRDVSGTENDQYRQLNTRIFEYDINNGITTLINADKPAGTLDMDPHYAPNDGSVIFMNTSNDGISQRNIYKITFDAELNRELIFENAFMPDWE